LQMLSVKAFGGETYGRSYEMTWVTQLQAVFVTAAGAWPGVGVI